MLGRVHNNMGGRCLLTALLTWCRPGETLCSYTAMLGHDAEYRDRQTSCAQSVFGATVGPAVGWEVKG